MSYSVMPPMTISSGHSSSTIKALRNGDRSAILQLFNEVLPNWQAIDESQLLIEPLNSGYSGAEIFKVSQRDSDKSPLVMRVPGNKSLDTDTQIFFKTSDPGISAAAQRAWSSSRRHATLIFQDNEQSPNVCITEYIKGQVGDAGLMNGDGAISYAYALGQAVGELHSWDNTWFEDCPGLDEAEIAVRTIGDEELRNHILELGSYSSFGKCFLDILVTESLTEGKVKEVKEIGSALFALLEQGSLMARLVVGHGDLKYDNTIIRSSSDDERPELVLIDYDRVMRLPAAADLGCYLHDPEPRSNKYPTLSNRRALADGYLGACSESGFDVTQFSHHELDDVVLAMEVGLLLRSLWLSTIMSTVFPSYRWVVPILRSGIGRAAKLIGEAKYDDSVREQLLKRGSSQMIGKSFVIPLLFKRMLKSFAR